MTDHKVYSIYPFPLRDYPWIDEQLASIRISLYIWQNIETMQAVVQPDIVGLVGWEDSKPAFYRLHLAEGYYLTNATIAHEALHIAFNLWENLLGSPSLTEEAGDQESGQHQLIYLMQLIVVAIGSRLVEHGHEINVHEYEYNRIRQQARRRVAREQKIQAGKVSA